MDLYDHDLDWTLEITAHPPYYRGTCSKCGRIFLEVLTVDHYEEEIGSGKDYSLSELKDIKGPFGLKVERDLYFGFEHTLAEVMEKEK